MFLPISIKGKVKVSYLTSVAKQAKTAFLHGPTVWKSPIVGIEPATFRSESAAQTTALRDPTRHSMHRCRWLSLFTWNDMRLPKQCTGQISCTTGTQNLTPESFFFFLTRTSSVWLKGNWFPKSVFTNHLHHSVACPHDSICKSNRVDS